MLDQGGWKQGIGEGLCVLGTMMFGSGIWLVAQIYHIQEHFPNGFMFWGIGALLMAWAMPSIAQGMLTSVFLTIWICTEASSFHTPIHWAPFFIFLAIGILSWRLKSVFLLVTAILAMCIGLLTNSGVSTDMIPLSTLLNISALFIAMGILAGLFRIFPESAAAWRILGWLGLVIGLYALSFKGFINAWAFKRPPDLEATAVWYLACTFIPALFAWLIICVLIRAEDPRIVAKDKPGLENWLPPLVIVLYSYLIITNFTTDNAIKILVPLANIVLFTLSVTWTSRGCRSGDLRLFAYGAALLIAVATARFDLFHNLATRGLAFVIAGLLVFGEGLIFTKTLRRAKETGKIQ
ncbi:MAG: DUF2157 domain-containing protein [Verrucomicrobia bacterium]|nr:DUF2157 domain-containing protein [Verrucomicrobiota bacterium]